MSRPRMWLAIIAIAVLLALIVTLASGAWRTTGAAPQGASEWDGHDPSWQQVALVATPALPGVPLPVAPPRTADVVPHAEPSGAIGTVLLGGYATWYATPGLTAAAGPELRGALGDWRGQWITVESGRRSVTVQITDFCACGDRHGIPTLLDLSDAAFLELAPLSAGVVRVSIEIDPPADPRDDAMRDEVRDPLPATDAL